MEFKRHRRSIRALIAQAHRLGIYSDSQKLWTEEETVLLHKYYPEYGDNIPELLAGGRNKDDINAKARREHIYYLYQGHMPWQQWTIEEDNNLRALFTSGLSGRNLISTYIANYPEAAERHTAAAIKARCKTLGLVIDQAIQPFTKEEDDYLLTHYLIDGSTAVGNALGRKRQQVQKRAKELGVKRATSLNAKQIQCVETGTVFKSGRDAASWAKGKEMKDSGSIGQQLKHNKQAIAYGYHWQYIEEED